MWVVNKKTKKLDVVFVVLPNAGDPFVFFSLFGGRHSVNSVLAFDHFPLGIRFAGCCESKKIQIKIIIITVLEL